MELMCTCDDYNKSLQQNGVGKGKKSSKRAKREVKGQNEQKRGNTKV